MNLISELSLSWKRLSTMAVLGCVAVFSMGLRAESPKPVAETILTQQEQDLKVFTLKLPHYKVEGVPATEALKAIWRTAIGREPVTVSFIYHDDKAGKNDQEPQISLDLKDASVLDIIRYIAELSASKWTLKGVYPLTLELTIERINMAVCVDEARVVVGTLSKEGANRLGLHGGITPAQVQKALAKFDVKLEQKRNDLAVFNADTLELAVAATQRETSFVASLVRLANAGLIGTKEGK